MNSSNLTKFAIGLAVTMGLLASFANTSSSEPSEEVPVSVKETPEVLDKTTVDVEISRPVLNSTAREKKATLSNHYKETQARRSDEIESQLPDWGEDGFAPTDSVTIVERNSTTEEK